MEVKNELEMEIEKDNSKVGFFTCIVLGVALFLFGYFTDGVKNSVSLMIMSVIFFVSSVWYHVNNRYWCLRVIMKRNHK